MKANRTTQIQIPHINLDHLQNQSFFLESQVPVSIEQLIKNPTDLHAVSTPMVCRNCQLHEKRLNCSQCSRLIE